MIVKLLSEFSPMTTEELQRLKVDSEEWFDKKGEPGSWEEKAKAFCDRWYIRAIIAASYIFLYAYLQRVMNPQSWVNRMMGGNPQQQEKKTWF